MDNKVYISSIDLLTLVKNSNYVEASLNDGIFNATHLIRFGGRKFFDTGIDSKEVSWKENDFLNFYTLANWKIDQIIK